MKKIVIIGPESTGKSTLCSRLAQYYKTSWCPEYAREYLLQHGRQYQFADLLNIAKGQLQLEEKVTQTATEAKLPSLFIDTDMYVMRVWCEFVFDRCHNWILDQITARKYDAYLLCNIDLPWVKDELREYPDLIRREKLYHHYKDAMICQKVPWFDISGNYEERLQKAIAAVDSLT